MSLAERGVWHSAATDRLARSSGHALRLAYWALRITGMYGSVHKMCAAPTLEEQRRIWTSRIRPIILSAFIRKVFLANPIFQWNSLGVPINQARVFLKETTTSQFAIDALDPIGLNSHVAKDNYFVRSLSLLHRHSR